MSYRPRVNYKNYWYRCMKELVFCTLLVSLVLTGCSTHMSKVEYKGTGSRFSESQDKVDQVVVTDQRGTDSNWLGAIRGGYGNRLKTLRTEESTDIIVHKIYTDALAKSGILTDSKEAPYKLQVVITKFDCSYYFNREAHAYVEVSLIENASSKPVFSKSYKTDETESGVGAGIFGDVDTLRVLSEGTMNKTVDKMLVDPEFNDALAIEVGESGSSIDTNDRLKALESLHSDGLLSDEEYQKKRADIISDL